MKQSNLYIVGFAAAICIVCSLLLSVIAGALAEKQEVNRILDRQKNLLMAAGFSTDKLAELKAKEVQDLYAARFESLVITPQGDVLEGKTAEQLDAKIASGEVNRLNPKDDPMLPLFRFKDETGKVVAYIYPTTGKGLWSTLYGYLAVKPDGSEIVGLAFYKHGETPGLGAEIEQPWFLKNFVGKELYEGDKLVGVEVVRGKVADKVGVEPEHAVDGISGATITGDGVSKMMRKRPADYDAFFDKLKSGKTARAGGQR